MKKILLTSSLILAAIIGIAFHYNAVSATPSFVIQETMASASTTLAFLSSGGSFATSTFQFDGLTGRTEPQSGNDDAIDLAIEYLGSTTASTLYAQYQYSFDGLNWYSYNSGVFATPTQTGITDEASTSQAIRWNPGTTATSTTIVILPPVHAPHIRVQFYDPVGTPAGGVYAEAWAYKLPTYP